MFWGAVSKGYKSSLLFIDGNLKAEKYRETLKNNPFFETIWQATPDNDVHFQQNGTGCYTAKKTVEFIKEQMPLVKWPPNSPDLSVIENIWAILKTKVAQKIPKDMPSLKAVVLEEWEAISQDVLESLTESAPSRFLLRIAHEAKSLVL
jgi:hypothetical protein